MLFDWWLVEVELAVLFKELVQDVVLIGSWLLLLLMGLLLLSDLVYDILFHLLKNNWTVRELLDLLGGQVTRLKA